MGRREVERGRGEKKRMEVGERKTGIDKTEKGEKKESRVSFLLTEMLPVSILYAAYTFKHNATVKHVSAAGTQRVRPYFAVHPSL